MPRSARASICFGNSRSGPAFDGGMDKLPKCDSKLPKNSRTLGPVDRIRCARSWVCGPPLFVKRARGYRLEFLFDTLSNEGAICDVGRVIPNSRCEILRRRARVISQRSTSCCSVCSKVTRSRCESCRHVFYCSPACQAKDWPFHKLECSPSAHEKR